MINILLTLINFKKIIIKDLLNITMPTYIHTFSIRDKRLLCLNTYGDTRFNQSVITNMNPHCHNISFADFSNFTTENLVESTYYTYDSTQPFSIDGKIPLGLFNMKSGMLHFIYNNHTSVFSVESFNAFIRSPI